MTSTQILYNIVIKYNAISNIFYSIKIYELIIIKKQKSLYTKDFNTKKYHVFAPMGRFQLELIYLYFPPSSHVVNTRWDDGGK